MKRQPNRFCCVRLCSVLIDPIISPLARLTHQPGLRFRKMLAGLVGQGPPVEEEEIQEQLFIQDEFRSRNAAHSAAELKPISDVSHSESLGT
jgi:hypothetical protein